MKKLTIILVVTAFVVLAGFITTAETREAQKQQSEELVKKEESVVRFNDEKPQQLVINEEVYDKLTKREQRFVDSVAYYIKVEEKLVTLKGDASNCARAEHTTTWQAYSEDDILIGATEATCNTLCMATPACQDPGECDVKTACKADDNTLCGGGTCTNKCGAFGGDCYRVCQHVAATNVLIIDETEIGMGY